MKKNILYKIVGLCVLNLGMFFCSTIESALVFEKLDGSINTISICDGNDVNHCVTLKDRNEGAISNDITSIDSYGSHYQWGNNYGFANMGFNYTLNCVSTQVDCTDYGPLNPYYSGVFIGNRANNCNPINNNLWGGSGDSVNNNYGYNTGTYQVINATLRQGPCGTGYHVPSRGEWEELMTLWNYGYADISQTFSGDVQFISIFKIPYSTTRDAPCNSPVNSSNSSTFLWTSSPLSAGVYSVDVYQDGLGFGESSRAYARSIRCFKNVPFTGMNNTGTNSTGTNTTGSDLTGNIEVGISSLGLIIGTPNSVDLGSMSTNTTKTFTFTEPFWIKDLRGASRGHYTTIQLNGLYQVGGNGVITGVRLIATSGAVLSGGIANGTQINPSMISNNGVDITNPVLFFYRENGQNSSGVVNQYISMPLLKINTRGVPAGTYRGSIVYTLYDIGYED